jgi:hypothetical protein
MDTNDISKKANDVLMYYDFLHKVKGRYGNIYLVDISPRIIPFTYSYLDDYVRDMLYDHVYSFIDIILKYKEGDYSFLEDISYIDNNNGNITCKVNINSLRNRLIHSDDPDKGDLYSILDNVCSSINHEVNGQS